jgi:signal transduction histidine kinase
LLGIKTITGFKIGGSVAIIILLLGIAVLFGTYQMSKVNQEVIQISEQYIPLHEIISDVRIHQANQANSLEKTLRFYNNANTFGYKHSIDEFWANEGIFESNISRAKNMAQAGIKISTSETALSENMAIYQKFTDMERTHKDFLNKVREIFLNLDTRKTNDNLLLLEDAKKLEIQLQNEMDSAMYSLSILTENAINQIEDDEKNSLIGQIIIVIIVGSIAASLVFFINQINKDLKKEVDTKTIDLKKANEKLKELDKMKDEFIGIASHELKSPIQPIFGFAELAKAGDIDQNEAWDGVVELANKLEDLANAVLDVSRIESNRLKLSIEKIPINDEILDIIKTVKINLKKDVSIQENLDENIEIEMDKMRFGQVFRNLLHNSIKFTSEGEIRIQTRVIQDENIVQIRVSDSGIGISDEILPRIFEKFVTKGKNQESQSGTGLGLFLCKGIISAHGGEITAQNNPDKGATFEFTLPILQSKLTEKVPKFLQNKKSHM